MKKTFANALISASKTNNETRKDYFNKLVSCKRNKDIDIHRDYYDGLHWIVDENGKASTTRSGKLIWGKGAPTTGSADDKLNRRSKSSGASFHSGQLQTHNYIQLFTHTYIDFLLGQGDDEISVSVIEGDERITNHEEAQTVLDEVWDNLGEHLKQQLARLVTDTVAVQSVSLEDGEYYVEIDSAKEFFPIYQNGRHVGSIKVCVISKEDAEILYNFKASANEELVLADVFLPDSKGQYYNIKYINGKILVFDGSDEFGSVVLPQEINFDPYDFVANINHPFRKFDENGLEGSEIFNWVDRVDSLNANETIEFVANQFYASPKVRINQEMAKALGISMKDPEFQQALADFQFSPGSVDSLPIEIVDGKSIPDSFYKGKETIKEALFEDAGIPQFIVNGSMTNVSTETIEQGMSMLVRKVTQKRNQLIELTKKTSFKILKAKRLLTEDAKLEDAPILVELPDVAGFSAKQLAEIVLVAYEKGVIPDQYATEQFLKAIGREEDLETIVNARQSNQSALLGEIEKRKSVVLAEQQAKLELERKAQMQKELEVTNKQIETLK